MPSKRKNYVRKSTGGKAPRKELFTRRLTGSGATSVPVDVEMSSARLDRIPLKQVSLNICFLYY
jgi:hypothetical protein